MKTIESPLMFRIKLLLFKKLPSYPNLAKIAVLSNADKFMVPDIPSITTFTLAGKMWFI